MSLVMFLADLILNWIGFVSKIEALAIPVFAALHVVYIVINDVFLSQHILFTLSVTALFSLTCCMLVLSRTCVLRRKSHAKDKTIDELYDSDLMYENETDEVPYYKLSYHYKDIGSTLMNFIFKNPFEFLTFRPAYGMLFLTGIVFVIVFAVAVTHAKEWNWRDDFYCVSLELTIPMIMLICVPYFMANSGGYTADKNDDGYAPFEEIIQVPMRIIVGKTVAILLTSGGTCWLLWFFISFLISLSVVSSNYLYHACTIDDVLKSLLPPVYPDQRRLLITVLIVAAVVCVSAIIGVVASAYVEARQSILAIIEKNWQRNMRAISFLLGDNEFETLQDLKTALDRKWNQPLTENEKKAFIYISSPIWRTKQPFMLLNFEIQ